MRQEEMNKKLNPLAFWPALVALSVFIFLGVFYQQQLGNFLNNLLYTMSDNLGWYLNLLSLLSLILVLVLAFGKTGNIKIGGADARPEFKTFNWCAMSICGGIGTGLLFWAMGEPIYHFATPPIAAGVEPFSRGAGIFAVSQAMWDWSFIQYAMYSLCAVAFALIAYNRKKSLSFGSIIERVCGRNIPWLNSIVHALIIFCLCGAVSNSMGVGLMQIGAGIQSVFGIAQSPMVWLIIAVVIGCIFILSCVSGIGTGLKKISSVTIYIFIGLLIYVAIFGDTKFIGSISAEAVGDIIDNWGKKTMMLNTMVPEDTWSADWILQYWASFIVYAPVIGMFLSRMAKGRTVRQFIMVNLLVPSLFCWVWIGIFGGMTIQLQSSGTIDVWKVVNELGMQATIYQIINSLPMGGVITVIFLVAVCFSFCTLADPMASVLATLSVRKLSIEDEPPRNCKILMGIIIAAVSYLLVASGGVNSVKGMFVLIGLLISVILILCVVAAFKLGSQCLKEKNDGVVDDEGPDLDLIETQKEKTAENKPGNNIKNAVES